MAEDEQCCPYDPRPETLLQASGTLNAVYAIPLLMSPGKAKKFFYVKHDYTADEATTARWFGFALACVAALSLAAGTAENTTAAKKRLLKATGVCWLAGAGLHLYNASAGVQKKQVALPCAALGVLMGGWCLVKAYFKKKPKQGDK